MKWLMSVIVVAAFSGVAVADDKNEGLVELFAKDGVSAGWVVRAWNDVSKPVPDDVRWIVRDGVLHSPDRRGSWLMSRKEYGDFILTFEVKLTERGNSGLALRTPMKGDPAFDGLELQIADLRYNTQAKPSELTGGLYRAVAPRKQVYKPTDWNRVRVELRGSHLKAVLNGVLIHDTDLSTYDKPVPRHDGTFAPPIRARPRRGHIGFQHLSRNSEPVLIRGVRIKDLSMK